MGITTDFERGARNLLAGCAGARAGERLLIVEEGPGERYYDPALGAAIGRVATADGLVVSRRVVPFQKEVSAIPAELAADLVRHDHALFLARLGDQLRFSAMPAGARPIVSYGLDRAAFAAPVGRAPYAAFVALKQGLDRLFAAAGHIRVTCPLGSDFRGRLPAGAAEAPLADVTVKRFPMLIHAPLDAAISGHVAVAHCLAGTGSRYYEPFGIALERPVRVRLEGNRVVAWEGEADTVARLRAHYAHVAGLFGIEPDFVHSWHAGIHPACGFAGRAIDDLERWSGSAFGNPRLLHFHTCGAVAPGEICWNIVDPTIVVDGVAIWETGRLQPERFSAGRAVLEVYPELAALFAVPVAAMGL